MYLPANTTSVVQPCDQSSIRSLQAVYRCSIVEWQYSKWKELKPLLDAQRRGINPVIAQAAPALGNGQLVTAQAAPTSGSGQPVNAQAALALKSVGNMFLIKQAWQRRKIATLLGKKQGQSCILDLMQ